MRWKVAIVTISDRSARGERADGGGPLLADFVAGAPLCGDVIERRLVPDEREAISSVLTELSDCAGAELVLTTGGTGLAIRDVTPEATLAVIDRQVPGLAEAMRAQSLQVTRRAMLSRAVTGTRGSTLIVNLPGNPRGAIECLEAIVDQLPHALGVLTGRAAEAEHRPSEHVSTDVQPSASVAISSKALAPTLREVPVEQAIGMVLAHDLTQIIPGQYKGRLFRKGHVVREEDQEALLRIGKEHLYVWEAHAGWLHEDEAATRIARAIAGEHIYGSEPHEGKISLRASIDGLLKIEEPLVHALNALDSIVVSTLQTNVPVRQGQQVTGTRIIPLMIEQSHIARLEQLVQEWHDRHPHAPCLVSVKPYRKLRVGLITTGSEVFKGRITDKFGPIVRDKVAAFGSEVVEQRFCPDELDEIVRHIRYFQTECPVDLLLLTGGMSVDPDDRTPGAIRKAGARVVSYGTPMLPGSMLLIGYLDDLPVMGLPGCVMHDPYTSFDVFLPRICAGEMIVREDVTRLGYGGLHGC